MEDSMEIFLKIRNKTSIQPSNTTSRHIPEETQNCKRHMYPNVPCTLFTIARTWKQHRCPSTDEWIKKLWYIYTRDYYLAIKREHIWVSSNEVDEPRAYYTEWSKSEREKQVSYTNIYMKSQKMVLMKLFVGQQWRHRHKEQTYGHGRRKERVWREKHGNLHYQM